MVMICLYYGILLSTKNKISIHSTIGMNLNMLRKVKKSDIRKAMYFMIPSYVTL